MSLFNKQPQERTRELADANNITLNGKEAPRDDGKNKSSRLKRFGGGIALIAAGFMGGAAAHEAITTPSSKTVIENTNEYNGPAMTTDDLESFKSPDGNTFHLPPDSLTQMPEKTPPIGDTNPTEVPEFGGSVRGDSYLIPVPGITGGEHPTHPQPEVPPVTNDQPPTSERILETPTNTPER